jgi:hypothetical protein
LASAVALVVAPGVAVAQRGGDTGGVYGRLDGDLVLSAEVMGLAADTSTGLAGAASVALRARYMEMTGAALGYDRAVSQSRHDALWLAVDFRPAWLARLTNDMERGPRWLDLALDSIGVEIGGAWLRPGEAVRAGGGFGFVLGGGVELPIVWSRGDGVMLRLAARWITSRAWDAQGTGARDGVFEAGVGVVFRTIVRTGTVARYE